MKFKNITKAYKISSIAEYNAIELRLGVLGIKPLSCNPKQEFTVDRRVFIHSSADNSHYYLHSEEATIYDIRCSTFENWCKECKKSYMTYFDNKVLFNNKKYTYSQFVNAQIIAITEVF